jgi:hypothetical protein
MAISLRKTAEGLNINFKIKPLQVINESHRKEKVQVLIIFFQMGISIVTGLVGFSSSILKRMGLI